MGGLTRIWERLTVFGRFALPLAIIAALYFAYRLFVGVLVPLFDLIARNWSTLQVPVVSMCIGVLAGAMLSVLRAGALRFYGTMEILFSVCVFFLLPYLHRETDNPLNTAVAYVSAVYVMVRGISNYSETLSARARKRWYNLFVVDDIRK